MSTLHRQLWRGTYEFPVRVALGSLATGEELYEGIIDEVWADRLDVEATRNFRRSIQWRLDRLQRRRS